MNKKLIWGIVIVVIGAGVAYAFLTPTRYINCCHGEQYMGTQAKTYSADGIEFQYPSNAQAFKESGDGYPRNIIISYPSTNSDAINGVDYNKAVKIQIFGKNESSFNDLTERNTSTDSVHKTSGIAAHIFVSDTGHKELFKIVNSTFKFTSPTEKQPLNRGISPSITILSPNGGETLKIGQTYKISFASTGDLVSKTIRLNKYSDDGILVDNKVIGTTNSDEFIFKVPSSIAITRFGAPSYKIQVLVDKYNDGMGVADESDSYFSITN